MTDPEGLIAALAKMERGGVSEAARSAFRDAYERLVAGESGELPGAELQPARDVPSLDALPGAGAGDALGRTVVLKLNGGLGTSMGLDSPKSLIEVKPGRTFLDVTVQQVLALRSELGARLPLVLMDSFSTQEATLAALAAHPSLRVDVPLDFLQSREPKLLAEDLTPVDWPADPELEWCPPGHGDLYPALIGSGMLDELLARGYEYAFCSNIDNLGAVLEPRVLGFMAREGVPFVMEVVEGTESDRKGGHIARRGEQLVLRESAQVPAGDDSFGDYEHWRYFNTNNLWLHLPALAENGPPSLPLIVNRKTVDPADPSSPAVLQLESAMGAAVGSMEGAAAVCVPRSRFAPVKTTNDLLVVRSDAYSLGDDGRLEPAGERLPVVDLDPAHFKLLRDFEARFPAGPPSLVRASRFVVRGDVTFGAGTAVVGDAEVSA